MCASPPPFAFFVISIANLHPLVIETAAFGKAFDYKMGLAFNAFDCEVKPAVVSSRVSLLIEADLKCVNSDQIDRTDVAAFKVRSKSCRSYFDDLAVLIGPNFISCRGIVGLSGGGSNN